MVTWIGVAGEGVTPSLERLRPGGDAGAVALRVQVGDTAWTTVLRPGGPRTPAPVWTVAGIESDARMLQVEHAQGRLKSLAAAEFTEVRALNAAITIEAETRVTDLHLRTIGDVAELRSSAPPRRLILAGGALASVRAVRLNGRELLTPGPRDAVVVDAHDWAWADPTADALPGHVLAGNHSCVA
jgi:hypothetical protein